jgi:hypothetical protein
MTPQPSLLAGENTFDATKILKFRQTAKLCLIFVRRTTVEIVALISLITSDCHPHTPFYPK